ncbi:hypothetical protein DPEC_G00369490 [Dallia pectoralis]|nr:hypothetical protein DPEC_G00369490 [Dallia pectoralis]
MARSTSAGCGLKVYSFSTFFFPNCTGVEEEPGVGTPLWWTVRPRTVRSYDSIGQRHGDICSLLLLYLREEHQAKKGKDLDMSKWTVSSLRASEIPQQKNGSDCGVFACKYADYIAQEGLSLSGRKLMIWEILNQKLV